MKRFRFYSVLVAGVVVGCSDGSTPSAVDGPGQGDGIVVVDGGGDSASPDGASQLCSSGCEDPPAPRCMDGATLRLFEAKGFCEKEVCNYGYRHEVCEAGCKDGACVGSPCQGKTCDTPPDSLCEDADTLKHYESPGTCDQGKCLYQAKVTPCAGGCGNGQCKGDPCAGKTCSDAPPNSCSDAMTLRSYSARGTCTDGACSYAHSEMTCPFGCEQGQCVGDPCAGKTCDAPPASHCKDKTTLRSFKSPGSCAGGSCTYKSVEETCPHGCEAGACSGDPCAGKQCVNAPADTCIDKGTLRTFATQGSCVAGSCTYVSKDVACPFGCDGGSCAGDPCVGKRCETPPAAYCKDKDTQRTFANVGSCGVGGCQYPATDTPCTHGCALGSCLEDPCKALTCDQAPADSCVDDTTLRVHLAKGVCKDSACSYPFSDQLCPGGCKAGVCSGPSCDGKVCNTPPAATCHSSTRLYTYAPLGTCDNGCVYQRISIDCSEGCFQGACLPGSQTTEYVPLKEKQVLAMAVDGNNKSLFLVCLDRSLFLRHKTLQGWQDDLIDQHLGGCVGSIAVDKNGQAHVAYRDANNADLRYAVGKTTFKVQLVATKGDMGAVMHITLDGNDSPVIAYHGEDTKGGTHIYLATRGAGGWSSEAIRSSSSAVTPEVRLDASGDYHLLYDTPVKYVVGKPGGTFVDQPVPDKLSRAVGRALTFGNNGKRHLLVQGQDDLVLRTYPDTGAPTDDTLAKPYGAQVQSLVLRGSWPPTVLRRDTREYYKTSLGFWSHRAGVELPKQLNRNLVGDAVGTDRRLRLGVRWLYPFSMAVITEPPCKSRCAIDSCGDDGCGGSCGSCGVGESCGPEATCSAWRFEHAGEDRSGAGDTQVHSAKGEVHILNNHGHWHFSAGSWKQIDNVPFGGTLSTFMDKNGVLHGASYGASAADRNIYVGRFENGSWSATKDIGIRCYKGIRLYVDDKGIYHIFHGQNPGGYTDQLRYTTWNGTSARTSTVHPSKAPRHARVLQDKQGTLHVLWSDSSQLLYSFETKDGWDTKTLSTQYGSSTMRHQFFQDDKGGFHGCYYNTGKRRMAYIYNDQDVWQEEGFSKSSSAACAMDTKGRLMAVNYDGLFQRTAANTWDALPLPMFRPATQSGFYQPVIQFDAGDRLHLAYVSLAGDGRYHMIYGVQ